MENLLIEKSEKTPYVEFNINGELRIEGRSIPEDSRAFYQGALNWLHEFRKINPQKVTLHIRLTYFNTSSSKLILSTFRMLEQFDDVGIATNIYWYHEEDDEDMIEAGNDYKTIVKLPFHFVQVV